MKICILGDTTKNIDEGMKKITYNIAIELSKNHEVLVLNPLEIFSLNFWRLIKKFNPQIVHYIPGPSIRSFMVVKIISYRINAKYIMSTPFPKLPRCGMKFIHLFRPNLMLVQLKTTEKMFKERGFNVKILPLSGVDIEKFIPVSEDNKRRLRKKYNLHKSKFIVSHVGHIKKGRNIQIFKKIQEISDDIEVIVVGSTSTGGEKSVYKELVNSGCTMITSYIQNIEEIYQLSDCYIFPTLNKLNSIQIPLSVLEAMACNLPVISTKFWALPEYFEEKNGLIFVENEEDFITAIGTARNNTKEINTRDMISSFSWDNIVKRLLRVYNEFF